MTQQAHGGARRVYGEWRSKKLMHISSIDDAGQGLLGENDWIQSIINQYVAYKHGAGVVIDENMVEGCGTQGQQHIMDFKPFVFRMSYQTDLYEYPIPFLDVRIEVDADIQRIRNSLVRKNIPLTKVTINGVTDLNMCSKSQAFGVSQNAMRNKCNRRFDAWHLQLMQKYIGDFIPIMYSFVKDVYYTTGDNMAIVQYLNMARLLKTANVTTTIDRFVADSDDPVNMRRFTIHSTKFRVLAEDGKHGLIRAFFSPNLFLQ